MRLALIAVLLSACTTPHSPARDGVWIVNPTPIVRCEAVAEGVVCRTVRSVAAEDVGI